MNSKTSSCVLLGSSILIAGTSPFQSSGLTVASTTTTATTSPRLNGQLSASSMRGSTRKPISSVRTGTTTTASNKSSIRATAAKTTSTTTRKPLSTSTSTSSSSSLGSTSKGSSLLSSNVGSDDLKSLLASIDHPNLCVGPIAPDFEPLSQILKDGKLNRKWGDYIIKQVLYGLNYLHSQVELKMEKINSDNIYCNPDTLFTIIDLQQARKLNTEDWENEIKLNIKDSLTLWEEEIVSNPSKRSAAKNLLDSEKIEKTFAQKFSALFYDDGPEDKTPVEVLEKIQSLIELSENKNNSIQGKKSSSSSSSSAKNFDEDVASAFALLDINKDGKLSELDIYNALSTDKIPSETAKCISENLTHAQEDEKYENIAKNLIQMMKNKNSELINFKQFAAACERC